MGKFNLSLTLFVIFAATVIDVGALWSWDKLSTYGKIITAFGAVAAVWAIIGVIKAVVSLKKGGLIGKKTHTDSDGWPVMEPLGAKEAQLRDQNMTSGERVLGQVIGWFDQAVIATTQKVLVVKHGHWAGQAEKATSYDYREITGVEVSTGFTQGQFKVIVGGLAAPKGKRNKDRIEVLRDP